MSRRKKKSQDPYAEREAEKYSNPIPSREFIMEYLKQRGKPATRAEIIEDLSLNKEEDHEALRRRLRAMERDGQLVFNRKGGYGLVSKMNLVRGTVLGHREGYGFMIPDEGGQDLFLSAHQMRQVFDGDRVLARVASIDRKGRLEGQIVEILERKTTEIVGRLFTENGIYFVIPENQRITQDIIVPAEQINQAKTGQYVIAIITTPPSLRNQAIGYISEVIGEHMAPGMEIDVAIRAYGLPFRWPEEVMQEIAHLTPEVSEQDKRGRVDLRDKPFVTIDGEDAKDYDDAVYCEKKPRGGYTLYVAIADVSHYVKPDTALDNQAYLRGNSVYFPGKVIPMLPEILSNELCSLKPNTDRLSIVCEMSITSDGRMLKHQFHEAVIHSHARMTYTNVHAILVLNNKTRQKQYQKLLPHLQNLYELYQILLKKRETRGALDFDTPETKVIFGSNRKIQEIVRVERNEAHKLIEECMLQANVAAAKFLTQAEIPCLYRVHEGPKTEKLMDLYKFLSELKLSLKGGGLPRPKDYAEVLKQIQDRDDKNLIQTVLLRSLSQAVYSPENKGHFGLAYEEYTHYTSPIRRYPDLLVHRGIRAALQQKNLKKLYTYSNMEQFGSHCSMTERRADEATYDVLNWLKCEYMQDRVGEEFEGIITGVTGFGVFVELKDIYVEGLLHITALPNDYYQFNPIRHKLIGERTGLQFALGDSISVRLAKVSLDDRKMDFEWVTSKKFNNDIPKKEKKLKSSKSNKINVKKTAANNAGKNKTKSASSKKNKAHLKK